MGNTSGSPTDAPLGGARRRILDDDGDNEDSDGTTLAWPAASERYAPVGDATSKVSARGSSRLAREFTMGAGVYHLTPNGRLAMSSSNTTKAASLGDDDDSVYTAAGLALKRHHRLKTLDIGGGTKATTPTFLDRVLLVTDAPHAMRVYQGKGPSVAGISLVRDGMVFSTGVATERHGPPLALELDANRPVLEAIELQSCAWLATKGHPPRLQKKISYLKLTTSSSASTLVFGHIHAEGFDGDASIYGPVERAHGNLCLSGIGFSGHRPISLQVVDLGRECPDAVDAMDTNVYYQHGVLSGNLRRSRCPAVECWGSITTDQDEVWRVLEGCLDAVAHASPSHGQLLPHAVDLLEGALNGDVECIHAVLRVDRCLTHTIRTQSNTLACLDPCRCSDRDRSRRQSHTTLVPAKQMWGVLANAVERIHRTHTYQPRLNSFNASHLQGSTRQSFWKAVFIFLTQAALLLLTLGHIWNHRSEVWPERGIRRWLKLAVSLCGTVVVAWLAKEYKTNFDEFLVIFPDYSKTTTLYTIDYLCNVVGGFVVTACTLVLLLETHDNLEIVLDATALLFVLELDEMMVEGNQLYVTGLYRAYFFRSVLRDLHEADPRYWDPAYLRKNQHYKIHLPSCSFLFPDDDKP